MSDLEEDGDKQDARAVMLMTPSPPPKAKAKKKKTRERHDTLHEKEDEDPGSDADDDDSTTEDSEERRKTRHRHHHQYRRRRRKERKRSPSPPPKVAIVPLDPEGGGGDAKKIGGCWDFLFNLIAMVVFASALSLYVMPGTMTPILFGFGGGGGGGNRPAESMTATALHPEWPLHTFETAGARKRTASVPAGVKRAVQSDAALYKKVINTLSYHVLRDDGKRVLCMWHLQHPVSIPIANVCVWKRRLPGVSIFSLGEPVAEEGMLLPMFNLEIKGYATNISKTVSESSITCGRSRLVARKRRPVVDIGFDTTTGKWIAVRLLVDESDETNAFALQQAWEESRGYMCDHDY